MMCNHRTIRSLLLVLVAASSSGCGGPTHAEWVSEVSAICTEVSVASEALSRDLATATDVAARARIEASGQQRMEAFLAKAEAVDRPEDDVLASQWLEVQREGARTRAAMRQTALAAPTPTQQMTMGFTLLRSFATDEHATKVAGLPENCGSRRSREEFERTVLGADAQALTGVAVAAAG